MGSLSPPGTIDLGELSRDAQPELAVAWPLRRRLWRLRDRTTRRLVGLAAVTALVLVTTGAAPAHPALTLQFTIETAGRNVTYDEGQLYVLERQPAAGGAVVAAYRWDDGAVRWRTSLPDLDPDLTSLFVWNDALLVISNVPDQQRELEQTTRLDQATGEPLWTQAGSPFVETGDYLLLTSRIGGTSAGGPESVEQAITFTAVHAETGSLAWSVAAPVRDYSYIAGNDSSLVIRHPRGQLASYDIATGDLRATATTAVPSEPDLSPPWGVSTVGSLALVTEWLDGEWVVNAYDVDTLRRLWTLTDVAAGLAGDVLVASPAACGDLLCVAGYQRAPLAVDATTGETVWSADWALAHGGDAWYEIHDLGRTWPGYALLSRSYWPVFMMPDQSPMDDRRLWLIETRTGRPVLDLRQWAGPIGLWQVDATGVLTRASQEGAWIGRLRPDLSGVDVLGQIDTAALDGSGEGGYCEHHTAHLVCVAYRQPSEPAYRELPSVLVEVWRLP